MRRSKQFRVCILVSGCVLLTVAGPSVLSGRSAKSGALTPASAGQEDASAARPPVVELESPERIKTLTWTQTERRIHQQKPLAGPLSQGHRIDRIVRRGCYRAPGSVREKLTVKYRIMTDDGRSSRMSTSVNDFALGKGLRLDHETKIARVYYFKPEPESTLFRTIPRGPATLREALASPGLASLGEKTVDGKGAVGYRIEKKVDWGTARDKDTGDRIAGKAIGTWEIWLDAKTKRFVRAKYTVVPDREGSRPRIVTYEDFFYNAPLDESLFSLEPEGYTLRPIRPPGSYRPLRRGKTPVAEAWPPARWKAEYGDRREVFIEKKTER